MPKHTQLGTNGEKLAVIFLKNHGYTILHTNWRAFRFEIDIIAQIENIIVFVEVKTRTSLDFGYPEEAVTDKKKRNIIAAAEHFFNESDIVADIRFDILSILFSSRQNTYEIRHFEDAFY